MEPTKRQSQILTFITESQKANGYPPTLREIGRQFGIGTTKGVADHLIALERKGHIIRNATVARGIRIVTPAAEEPNDTAVSKWARLDRYSREAVIQKLRRLQELANGKQLREAWATVIETLEGAG